MNIEFHVDNITNYSTHKVTHSNWNLDNTQENFDISTWEVPLSIPPLCLFADATPSPSLLDQVFHRGWRTDIHDVENIPLVVWMLFYLIFGAIHLDEC